MRIELNGQVALVTGAAQGIGQSIALALRAAGARVHLADRDADGLQAFGEAPEHRSMPAHTLDVADRAAAHDTVRAVLEREGRLDILVNAAGGVCGQSGQPLETIDEQAWYPIFRANVDGAFWLSQAAATPMKVQGRGRLIHIASGAGLRPSLTGIQAYTAAKHALVGLTRQLSLDLGPHGITSNAVAPGFIRSNPSSERQWQAYGPQGQQRLIDAIHLRRLGQPQDIAHAAVFLASDQAGWISGQILSVDGGRS